MQRDNKPYKQFFKLLPPMTYPSFHEARTACSALEKTIAAAAQELRAYAAGLSLQEILPILTKADAGLWRWLDLQEVSRMNQVHYGAGALLDGGLFVLSAAHFPDLQPFTSAHLARTRSYFEIGLRREKDLAPLSKDLAVAVHSEENKSVSTLYGALLHKVKTPDQERYVERFH